MHGQKPRPTRRFESSQPGPFADEIRTPQPYIPVQKVVSYEQNGMPITDPITDPITEHSAPVQMVQHPPPGRRACPLSDKSTQTTLFWGSHHSTSPFSDTLSTDFASQPRTPEDTYATAYQQTHSTLYQQYHTPSQQLHSTPPYQQYRDQCIPPTPQNNAIENTYPQYSHQHPPLLDAATLAALDHIAEQSLDAATLALLRRCLGNVLNAVGSGEGKGKCGG